MMPHTARVSLHRGLVNFEGSVRVRPTLELPQPCVRQLLSLGIIGFPASLLITTSVASSLALRSSTVPALLSVLLLSMFCHYPACSASLSAHSGLPTASCAHTTTSAVLLYLAPACLFFPPKNSNTSQSKLCTFLQMHAYAGVCG